MSNVHDFLTANNAILTPDMHLLFGKGIWTVLAMPGGAGGADKKISEDFVFLAIRLHLFNSLSIIFPRLILMQGTMPQQARDGSA